ncbi:hypothetical protein MLD38_027458 [Melastoma candidum]|uniref:Uncharacterized protein n=1 Tax=Melastoma candidum TaxID=119954 RepID=A0ACB9P2B0_9MYRT|nr:hypothetical protein MLD38_027458 [Melastoma candidum]
MGRNNNCGITKKKPSPSDDLSWLASTPSFSLFGFLKPRRMQKDGGARDTEAVTSMKLKVWPSDYDRGLYVAEPGIDRKASVFIEKFHASRDPPLRSN